MALNRYVLTSTVTTTPDTAATVVAGEPGTGGPAGFGNAATVAPATAGKFGLWAHTFVRGASILLDPAGALFSAIGSGNLRAFVDGTDTVSRDGLAN